MALGSPELARKREAVVRAHIEAENRHDPAGVVATFHHPGIPIVALINFIAMLASAVNAQEISH